MASFFFNVIRAGPTSPSTPPTSIFNSDEQNKEILLNGIVDYCGVFDANSMKWTSRLPSITSSTTTSTSPNSNYYYPHFDCSASRNQNGIKNGFVEQHLTLREVNSEYENIHLKYHLEKQKAELSQTNEIERQQRQRQQQQQQIRTNRSIVRIVSISDTHQFAQHVTLPKGDILVHQGDILHSDRLNPGFVSNYYITEFLEWLNAQPFAAKIFICGNHDGQFAALGVKKIRELCANYKNIHFLAADAIVDVFGVRFYGNSFSFGKSPNKAFQDAKTFDDLQKDLPFDTVIDGLDDDDITYRNGNNNNHNNRKFLKRRKDDSRAVDFFITHSRLHGAVGEKIVQRINPMAHMFGHDHDLHGVCLGSIDRGHTWLSDTAKKFARRGSAAANDIWNYMVTMTPSSPPTTNANNNNNNNKTVFIDNLIPEINASIVAELHKWSPLLHPPLVFDVIVYIEE